MNLTTRLFLPLIVVFLIINLLIYTLNDLFIKYSVDSNVLIGANLLFFMMNIVVFLVQKNAMTNSNPNVFFRSVIGGMMFKMFMCVIAVLIYVVSMDNVYDSTAVFISLFLYLIYLATEVGIVIRLNRNKNA